MDPVFAMAESDSYCGGSHLVKSMLIAGVTPANETCCSNNALASPLRTLSERMCSGTPRRMNRSDSTSMTSIDLSRRETRMARHSWVNSSIDPPPVKWSSLSYVFAGKEDRNAKEDLQAGGDRCQAAAG